MDELLKTSLEPGEQLLWSGQAEPFETLDVVYKKRFTIVTAVCALVAVLLIIGYIIIAREVGVKLLFILLILALTAIAPLNVISDAGKLRKTLYAVTDRRLITVREAVRSVAYDKIQEAALRKDEAGHTSLLCGVDALKGKPWKLRECAVLGPRFDPEDDSTCQGFVFYAVQDVDGLKKALGDRLPGLK